MVSRLTNARTYAMLVTLLAVGCLSGASGCERSSGANGTAPAASPKPASLVSFPEALQAEDPEINAFIRRAIDICVTEDYEAFRLLWSALEEPLGEQEFRKGFRAARKVSILDLAARRTPDSEVVYLVHCLVELDPDQVPEPTRDIVLLLRKENDAWRVARPPSKEIRALKAKYARAREAMNATSNGVEIAGGSSQ